VQLSLRQADILEALAKDEKLCDKGGVVPDLQVVSRYDWSGGAAGDVWAYRR
jgi:hypothetical protein